jgi:hypothetical protein
MSVCFMVVLFLIFCLQGYINPARDWTAPPPGQFGNLTWADASAPKQMEAINRGLQTKKRERKKSCS